MVVYMGTGEIQLMALFISLGGGISTFIALRKRYPGMHYVRVPLLIIGFWLAFSQYPGEYLVSLLVPGSAGIFLATLSFTKISLLINREYIILKSVRIFLVFIVGSLLYLVDAIFVGAYIINSPKISYSWLIIIMSNSLFGLAWTYLIYRFLRSEEETAYPIEAK